MGVKPDDAKPVGVGAGDCTQAAVAIARKHQREGAAAASHEDSLRESSIQLDHTRDLGPILINRFDALDRDPPARILKPHLELLVCCKHGRADSHPKISTAVVVRPHDELKLH